jgi:hypothetical protein
MWTRRGRKSVRDLKSQASQLCEMHSARIDNLHFAHAFRDNHCAAGEPVRPAPGRRPLTEDGDPTLLLREVAQVEEKSHRPIIEHLTATCVPPIGEARYLRHLFLDKESHRTGGRQKGIQFETVRMIATARQATREIFGLQQSFFNEKQAVETRNQCDQDLMLASDDSERARSIAASSEFHQSSAS